MKYKKAEEVKNTPGEIIDADIEEISIVDRAANGRKFLLKKGMSMNEELKKKLEGLGFNADQIAKMSKAKPEQPLEKLEKAVNAIIDLESEELPKDVTEGFMSKLKKVFVGEPKSEVSELKTLVEGLAKKVDSFLEAKPEPSASEKDASEDLKKREEELEKSIKEEEELLKKDQEKSSKIEELEKKLENLRKMRLGGNSAPKVGSTGLSSEELKKREIEDLFQGTALDLKF